MTASRKRRAPRRSTIIPATVTIIASTAAASRNLRLKPTPVRGPAPAPLLPRHARITPITESTNDPRFDLTGGLVALFTQACATQSTAAEYSSVRELAHARAQLELPAEATAVGRDELESEVRVLVRRPLTETTAVRIALLNNHDLRAELQSLGIARGELVQATVLPNPEFEVAMRVPERSGEDLQWDLAVWWA